MALLKCKMCGGDLEIIEDVNIAECEYCGTKQTVPVADNEKKLGLFNRANRLRMASEFDKAASVYENIISDFPEEAEAYWGLCLCNYGIEYVDDPATGKKIPTCHRSSFESILDSNDFEMVMENADAVSRKQYRDEAKAIEELRKAILEVSSKEEPYDIFICYKETDEKGDRTIDSVIAQDVYNELTDKGYRVFFSRITLEDKLGQEYEPYIFAALNSAKIMLAFGTDYEYYNAVWVKNEWSRFLQLIARGEKKTLIPCYKNTDAYDMPKEFARLQAQDMGKVGAVQDLLRGIEKIIGKNAPVQQVTEKVVVTSQSGGPNVEALLKRGNMALEDGNFNQANDFFNQVLNMNAECAEAYLGLAMAEENAETKRNLVFKNNLDNRNYQRAKLFADSNLLEKLNALEAEAAEDRRIKEEERIRRETIKKQEKEEKRKADIKRLTELRNKKVAFSKKIDSTSFGVFGVTSEGRAVAVGTNIHKESNVSGWKDIVAISAGDGYTVGLKSDGTVIVAGKSYNVECSNFKKWRDIIAIDSGNNYTVGLKSNGTVVAVGENDFGQCNVSDWTDIVAVSATWEHTVGLKSNGTVVAVGNNEDGQCDVSKWTDIVEISNGYAHTVGLKSDGTVVAVGENRLRQCAVSNWKDIISISADGYTTVGLKSDGTVVVVGDIGPTELSCINKWKNIVAVSTGGAILGLKSDGTIVADNYYGISDIKNWKLFNNIDNVQKNSELNDDASKYRSQNLCQHCGGTFKGLFTKKCTSCGKEKDY